MDEGEGSSTNWRIHLQPDTRLGFANSIMEAMRMERRMPIGGEVLGEIKRIAVEFEEGIYSSATSQSDYVRGISLKLHTISTRNQNYAQGEGAAMDGASLDWRTQLSPDARQRIVNKIMETLKRHLPISVPEGLNELKKIAVRFEEKIYTAATSQSDYLRKISLKMLSMETKSQHSAPINPSISNGGAVNQNPTDPGTDLKNIAFCIWRVFDNEKYLNTLGFVKKLV